MAPEEWEQLADQTARELAQEVEKIEASFWPHPPGGSYRSFWPQVKVLNERVRLAPAIKLDDKLGLQHRLNELCQRARLDAKRLQEEREATERELRDALQLVRETLDEATTIPEIGEARSDLAALRDRVTAATRGSRRPEVQALWAEWQELNGAAWTRLNELWAGNETHLTSTLDAAEQALEAGRVRDAKEAIKLFHAEAAQHECSHRALRGLKGRAATLWQRANDLGREKHEQYVQHAAKRMQRWRHTLERRALARSALERQITQLEHQSRAAGTPIAAALLRGQLEQCRRELHRLEAEVRDLEGRIASADVLGR